MGEEVEVQDSNGAIMLAEKTAKLPRTSTQGCCELSEQASVRIKQDEPHLIRARMWKQECGTMI